MNPISSWWLHRRHKFARSMFKGSIVVDVGSRTERVRPNVIAIDINRSYHPDIVASADYLPFRDRFVDYISFLEVIEHLDFIQIDKMLKEARRVGKILVVSTPNIQSFSWNIAWSIWSNTFGAQWHDAHKSFFSKEGLISLLNVYGYSIDELVVTRWHLVARAIAYGRIETVREKQIPKDSYQRTELVEAVV